MTESSQAPAWKRSSLLSLADYHNGAAFNPSHWGEEGLPIIRIEQINNPSAPTDFYTGPLAPQNAVTTGDLIFSWSATLKAVIWKNGDGALNQHLFKVVPKNGTNKAFLKYVLEQNMERISSGSQGSTMKHITRGELQRYQVEVPALEAEQDRIAEILSTLDEAIEQTEALIAKHQQIKAGLMHDLFTRGVTPDGHLRPTREQAPDLYKESPLGWIPKEWEVVSTEDCATKAPGSTTIGPFGSDLISSDYRSEGVPVVFVRDVKEDAFVWNSDVFITHEKAQQLSAHAVRSGDLLSTKMGLPPCVCCEYPNWMEDGVITADIIRLRPDPAIVNTRWLSAALNSDAFKRQVQAITAGVTRPKVTLSDFRKLRLARPGLAEQTMSARRLVGLADLSSSEKAKLDKLHKQKRGLMHDLLTGKVPVNATPNVQEDIA